MSKTQIIRVSDFAVIPGARYRSDGDNSAEEFFEGVVKEAANTILLNSKKDKLIIDLDGTKGYPSSFISELAKLCSQNYKKIRGVKKRLFIKSEEDPGLIGDFWDGFKKTY